MIRTETLFQYDSHCVKLTIKSSQEVPLLQWQEEHAPASIPHLLLSTLSVKRITYDNALATGLQNGSGHCAGWTE